MPVGRQPMGTVAYLGGVPALLEGFVWSWGQLIQYNEEYVATDDYYIHYDRTTFSDHAAARNSLAERFLGDWLVMLDTDHVFEPDVVARLVRFATESEIDVLSGIYVFKTKPHLPVAFRWIEDEEGNVNDPPRLTPIVGWDQNAKLLEIGSVGAGCLFVRRHVFDRIRLETKQEPFSHIHDLSEDHSFFSRLDRLEIKAYIAPSIECRHISISSLGVDDIEIDPAFTTKRHEVGGFE